MLDESVGAEPFKIGRPDPAYVIDLSKIDFGKLQKRFEKKRPTNTDLERLRAAVRVQLERMVRLNPTRADYLEKFQALIDSYNNGSRNIEEIFRELVALSQVLSDEQSRHVREHLSEAELTVFDILTRPGPDLTTEEREEVKKVAGNLLKRLHELLVLDWRERARRPEPGCASQSRTCSTKGCRGRIRRMCTVPSARRCSSMCMRATWAMAGACTRKPDKISPQA